MNQYKFQPQMISRSIAACVSAQSIFASIGGTKSRNGELDKKYEDRNTKILKTA